MSANAPTRSTFDSSQASRPASPLQTSTYQPAPLSTRSVRVIVDLDEAVLAAEHRAHELAEARLVVADEDRLVQGVVFRLSLVDFDHERTEAAAAELAGSAATPVAAWLERALVAAY